MLVFDSAYLSLSPIYSCAYNGLFPKHFIAFLQTRALTDKEKCALPVHLSQDGEKNLLNNFLHGFFLRKKKKTNDVETLYAG